LGHARGVALLAATQAHVPIAEYSPAEVKRAVVGYGRAEKTQVAHMVRLLLGLNDAPQPADVSDALAVAICHLHTVETGRALAHESVTRSRGKSWRRFKVGARG
jgi:crossover junction endodeoxyribonuclease RuvC